MKTTILTMNYSSIRNIAEDIAQVLRKNDEIVTISTNPYLIPKSEKLIVFVPFHPPSLNPYLFTFHEFRGIKYFYLITRTTNLPTGNQPQQLIVLYNNGSAVASLGIAIYLVINGNVGEWIIVAIDNSSNSYSFNSLSLFVTNWAVNYTPGVGTYGVFSHNSYQFASANITGQKTSNQALVIIWEITFTFPPNEFSPIFIWFIIGNTPNATGAQPINATLNNYGQNMNINYVGGSTTTGFNFIPSYDSSNVYLTLIGEYVTTSSLQILNITFVISDASGTFQSPAITPAYASTPGVVTGILTLIFTPT